MTPLHLTIPWSMLASSNQRNRRMGGKAHGWAYKAARTSIGLLSGAMVPHPHPHVPEASVGVVLAFYPPDKRKRDVSNLVKVLFDALQGVVYTDDYQIRWFKVERMEPDGDPRVDLLITEIP